MAPRKRKNAPVKDQIENKRMTKGDIEKLICKKKLEALEKEESQIKEDRFSPAERKRLLEAYNEHGFKVFQDVKLLKQYFPTRAESDFKGLIDRLTSSLQANVEESPIDGWLKLSSQMMGSFAKIKTVQLDNVYSDVLREEARELTKATTCDCTESSQMKPDYQKLLESFAQLLEGKFPDSMSRENALVSIKLFEHINSIVDSFDLKSTLSCLEDGTWLNMTINERHRRQEEALKGLEELGLEMKKCPTARDLETNPNIEALCLELPKIKRITDNLNPLQINDSMVTSLMSKNKESSLG